ncbi:MAG: haloacid dehalogenase-like hydrolase [Bacteroidota bacterium]
MHVFDFDKTLTNQDTLFGFYREASRGDVFFGLKRLLLLGCAILYKINIINNDQLKQVGVYLFLNGKTKDAIAQAAIAYAQQMKLNDIYHNNYLSTPPDERMIISASLEEYLSVVFPQERLLGSSLKYTAGKVSGLKQNMYKQQKATALQALNILRIEKVYTDSFSDQPLMEMAKEVALIKNGIIVKQWKPKSSMSD